MLNKLQSRTASFLSVLLAVASASQAGAATASVQYTYDQLGRVATALYDNGVCVVYAYDPVGNRTSQTNTASGAPEAPTWGAGTWGCFNWTAQHVELSRPLKGRQAETVTPIRQAGR